MRRVVETLGLVSLLFLAGCASGKSSSPVVVGAPAPEVGNPQPSTHGDPGPTTTTALLSPVTEVTGNCITIRSDKWSGATALTPPNGTALIHVEFWWPGQPEREAILDSASYNLARPLNGTVWYYASGDRAYVRSCVDAHIARRMNEKANNEGYASQTLIDSLFQRVR